MLNTQKSYLNCFYDFAVSPCSYDFFSFLVNAEICRKRRQFSNINLIFVKGPNSGFRHDPHRTDEQNLEFYLNVILPGLHILPTIAKYSIYDREDLIGFGADPHSTFPRGYSVQKPTFDYLNHERIVGQLRGDASVKFESQDFAKKIVKQKLQGNNVARFATLTTREIERDDVGKTRQPKRKVWERIFEALREKGITPIVVRDTACAFDGKSLFEGVLEFPEASLNPQVRLALYEQSEINYTKNNGPGFLQLFAFNRAMYFNEIDEGVTSLSSNWFEKGYGMSVEEKAQYPMTTNNVIFRWGDECFDLAVAGLEELSSVSKSCATLNEYAGPKTEELSKKIAFTKLLHNMNFVVLPEDLQLLQRIEFTDASGDFIPKFEFIGQLEGNGLRKGVVSELISLSDRLQISI